LRSLLGFGGPVKYVFKALEGNPGDPSPDHTHAPNSDWLWDRVIELLQGVEPKAEYVHPPGTVDTTTGEPKSAS